MEALLLIFSGFYFCAGQCFFADWFYYLPKRDFFIYIYYCYYKVLCICPCSFVGDIDSSLLLVFLLYIFCCSRVIIYVSFSVSYIYASNCNYVLADVEGGVTLSVLYFNLIGGVIMISIVSCAWFT